MLLIYLYLNRTSMTNDELLLCASSVVFFSFLFNNHLYCSLMRCYRAVKKKRENASTHTHTYIYIYEKEGPWHDGGLFRIKVTLATTSVLPLLSLQVYYLFHSLSLSRLDISIMICVVLFFFFLHFTCTFSFIYFWSKRR